MNYYRTLCLTTVLFSATSAFAQEATFTPAVVVTATRIPTPYSQVGSSITVIDSDDIENKQLTSLPDVLQDVPGLNLIQTGGLGGKTSLFVRGTNSTHTKVLLDGIDISDPTIGSFDLGQFLTQNTERVEVLRGPQSGLYGSDAIGGVVNIITKKGQGPVQYNASAEIGSFKTFNQSAGVSGSKDRFNYNLNVTHLHAGSTPVTPLELLAPGDTRNNDTYDNKTLSANLGATLTDQIDVGLVTHYIDTGLHLTSDGNTNYPFPDSIRTISQNKELFTRATAHQVLFNGGFDHTFGVGYTDYRRDDFLPSNSPYLNRGNRIKYDWQGNVKLMPSQTVMLGAERQTDSLDNPSVVASSTTNAVSAQLQSSFGKRLFNTTSLRYDNNNNFGGKATYRVAPAYLIPETGSKLKASVGTGFKAPSLVDLFVSFPGFGFFANPNLKPEQSIGYDAGFEQFLLGKRVLVGSTYFHNSIKDLIAINDAGTTNINISQATTYGFESFASYMPMPDITLRADHTYTMATNDRTEQELLRRPKHKASLNAEWKATDKVALSGTLLYVGSWVDVNRNFTVPRLLADGYTTVNIAANYDIQDNVTLFSRIDNLLDRRYENPVGFLQPGLGAYVGVKTKF